MLITLTELKNNLGEEVPELVNPYQNRIETAKSLFGILPEDADINEAREERLN
ncbi:MAG: type II toxin-antitoxin system prevent-host-death family antitoxin [Bariatricus sp.]